MSQNPHLFPEQDIAEGSVIGDHFLITRKLGAGGMGEVYLAENLNLPDKRYAIKVLRKELTEIEHYARLLEGEAQKQARLDHENIVQIYDYFRWQQRYCLILAFVDGTTLADMIEAEPGGLKEKQALALMLEVLKGVNHAHEQGVLHCDIKPANVLVDTEQRVRVTDFGIARDIGRASPSDRGVVVGTPEYMSPEQIIDPDHVDHRADVFSSGVMLFEMLTGQLPFMPRDDARFPQLDTEPADIRGFHKELSPQLSRIVTTALQRDPAARFQGCIEFQQAILGYQRRQRFQKTWLPAIVVVCILSLAGAIGSYQWKQAIEAKAVRQRLENERVAQEEKLANDARARKTIDASISSAIKQLGSLCRESIRMEGRRAAVETAKQAQFPDLVAKFEKQVEDMRRNMADYSRGYAEAQGQLSKFEVPMVDELIESHPQQDPESAKFLDVVRSDHTALAEHKSARGDAELLAACPK